jgi:hypothetical protein
VGFCWILGRLKRVRVPGSCQSLNENQWRFFIARHRNQLEPTKAKKESVFNETRILHKGPDPCIKNWAKSLLSDLSFSVCLLHILSFSSPLHSPILSTPACLPLSHLGVCFYVTLNLHVIVLATSETNSPSLPPNFRFPIERIFLTQVGTQTVMSRKVGFKV